MTFLPRRCGYSVALGRLFGVVIGLFLAMSASASSATALPDSARAQAAAQRVAAPLQRDLADRHLAWGAPIYLRIFKRESEMELWMRSANGTYVLFRSYPICKFSGELGPKRREGDKQAPEGFYSVAPRQLNPNSDYHLAFNLGYPNAFDLAHGYTGSELMVHGNCVSVGCYAMGDAAIEQIYTLAVAALRGGQDAFPVHVFPFRPTRAALEAQANSPWFAFWSELAPAYDDFERTRVPPRIRIDDGHYRVNAN